MDIKQYNDPWPHFVVDNFLPDHLFKELLDNEKEFINLFKETYDTSKQHLVWNQNQVGESIVLKSINDELFHKYVAMFPELNECYTNLRNHFLENHNKYIKEFYEKLSKNQHPKGFYFGVQIQAPNYKYGIHPDSPHKMMSTVVFLSEKNVGTWLYKSIKQDYNKPTKKVEWKPNRALIFVRGDNTFHSFHTKIKDKYRFTLSYNLTDGT